jgi:hypothetical protein
MPRVDILFSSTHCCRRLIWAGSRGDVIYVMAVDAAARCWLRAPPRLTFRHAGVSAAGSQYATAFVARFDHTARLTHATYVGGSGNTSRASLWTPSATCS